MNKSSFRINIGSSSILIVFVTLSLVAFATLSLSSSVADFNLSNKVKERSDIYYQACEEAYTQLREIDQTLLQMYQESSSSDSYYEKVSLDKSFIIPMTQWQSLQIQISILYPESDRGPFYSIHSWQVITTSTPNYDDTLPVIGAQ